MSKIILMKIIQNNHIFKKDINYKKIYYIN